MADLFPFQPYRYTDAAGRLADLVTQPYDQISPEMRARSLSPDPKREVDRQLEACTQGNPAAAVVDEYGAEHRLWKIADPSHIAAIRRLMADKKLLIADGHHRYETAVAFRNENPGLAGASRVM